MISWQINKNKFIREQQEGLQCFRKAGAWPYGDKLSYDHWSPIPQHTNGHVHKVSNTRLTSIYYSAHSNCALSTVIHYTAYCSSTWKASLKKTHNIPYEFCIIQYSVKQCISVYLLFTHQRLHMTPKVQTEMVNIIKS